MTIDAAVDKIGVKAAFSAGNFAYLQIPADSLRGFFDNLFPVLSQNPLADSVSGFGHRFVAGHDLLIDVPRTLSTHGSGAAAKHAGHILLTDFPTKAGIPIPGLSNSGLGNFLTHTCHIPRGYLCLNVVDSVVGIFAMTEGTFDLINVISGQLRMSPELFFDTFVEGTAEIAAGLYCKNPLLFIAGTEQLAAGVISTFYTITHPLWFVNPLDFFSGVFLGGISSFVISKLILKKDMKSSLTDAGKSCVIAGLFAISTGFGVAGIVALLACGIGKMMAERDNKEKRAWFAIGENELIRLRICTSALLGEDYNHCWFFENADKFIDYFPECDKKSFVEMILPEQSATAMTTAVPRGYLSNSVY